MAERDFYDTVSGLLHRRVRRPIELNLGERYLDDNELGTGQTEDEDDGRPRVTSCPPGLKGDPEGLVRRVVKSRKVEREGD